MSQNLEKSSELQKNLNVIYFLTAIILVIVAINFSAYKFKLTTSICLNKDIKFGSWLQVFVKSYILNNLVPYSGIAYRGIFLKKTYCISYTEYLGVTYLYVFAGLIFLLTLASWFLSFHHQSLIFIILLFFGVILIKLKFYFFDKVANFKFKSEKFNFYLLKLQTLEQQLRILLLSKKRFQFLIIFLCALCIDFLVYVFVFLSIQPDTPWYLILYIYLPYSLSWLFKVSPGNIGVQEFMMAGATTMAGLGSVSGVALSLLLRFTNLAGAFALWTLISFLMRKR